MTRLSALLLLCVQLLLAPPTQAQVMMEHLLGKYATTDDGCEGGAKPEYEIRRGIVEGPNLLCILGAPKDAGIGEEAYEAKCTQGDKVHLGTFRPHGQARAYEDQAAGKRRLDRALSLQVKTRNAEMTIDRGATLR